MELDNDWITKGWIDLEYKQYVLMAYLQDVRRQFEGMKLYPYLSDIHFHYNNLKQIQEHKQLLSDSFPKEISKIDLKKLQLSYRRIINDSEVMNELDRILEFATPRMKQVLEEGKNIFDDIEGETEIEAIGIEPIYRDEGYFLVNEKNSKHTRVFRYSSDLLEHEDTIYRGLTTQYLFDEEYSISNTFETIKLSLIRKFRDLPNPATYLVRVVNDIPMKETILPITKRMIIRYINRA